MEKSSERTTSLLDKLRLLQGKRMALLPQIVKPQP